jgi:hypothetical protein
MLGAAWRGCAGASGNRLETVEPEHAFAHVNDLGWNGTTDTVLFGRAAAKHYEVIVALDRNQLTNADEWKALKKSRLHHVSVKQNTSTQGARGRSASLRVSQRQCRECWTT